MDSAEAEAEENAAAVGCEVDLDVALFEIETVTVAVAVVVVVLPSPSAAFCFAENWRSGTVIVKLFVVQSSVQLQASASWHVHIPDPPFGLATAYVSSRSENEEETTYSLGTVERTSRFSTSDRYRNRGIVSCPSCRDRLRDI